MSQEVNVTELFNSPLSTPALAPYIIKSLQYRACTAAVHTERVATLRGSGYETLVPYDLTTPQYPGEPERADWKVARLGTA
jgi:hypothetical protein